MAGVNAVVDNRAYGSRIEWFRLTCVIRLRLALLICLGAKSFKPVIRDFPCLIKPIQFASG